MRVDPLTDEVVGLQIESFLTYAVKQHPDWIRVLTYADLHGYDDIEAAKLRKWARGMAGEDAMAYDLVRDVERLRA